MEESVTRRLRLLLLQSAVALGDWLGAFILNSRRSPPRIPKASSPGLSVVIPERGNPELLGLALESIVAAGRDVSEPFEIVVVVNGSSRGDYRSLAGRYPDVRWFYVSQPLGFSDAIRRGVKATRFDWVYLANNDVVLDPMALVELLPWRAPRVFAVASQILPAKEGERREETGWTDLAIRDGLAEIFDAPPEGRETRGALYAGGGSSLFRKELLLRYIGRRDPYEPFYWEDVEWGARAWMNGFQVLFCPASRVWHHRRATVSKFFASEEADRIFQRNAFRFQLRNLSRLGSLEKLWAKLTTAGPATFAELTRWSQAASILAARFELALSRFDDSVLPNVRRSYHLVPPGESKTKPTVVVVSPYAVYPPSHGGAIRIYQLLRRLAREFRIVLLSDEAAAYSAESAVFFRELAAAFLISGRPEPGLQDRISRIESHSHRALRQTLSLVLELYDPALVDVEFIEMAPLISLRDGRARWLISLHDVLFGGAVETEADRRERALVERYDASIASSREDLALLAEETAWLVPNGVDTERIAYTPSGGCALLFAGPFRYLPNFQGIRRFLELVYPRLAEEVHGLEVWLLGGPGAIDRTGGIPCFRQRGVLIYDDFTDPYPFLERCTLTINPLNGIRGSSIKLIESIASGRVVVSTLDGARGFLQDGFPSLIAVERMEDFLEPILKLLKDPAYRREIEQPYRDLLDKHSWDSAASKLAEVYKRYIDDGTSNAAGKTRKQPRRV